MADNVSCFVIMPFRPELNYFYLYLQRHLSEQYNVHVERGDHRILTVALMDKIRRQILEADIIICDTTGNNPNVFYELGLADAHEKPTILITQDSIGEAPSDIRYREFIHYDLGHHEEFLAKLRNAIHNLLWAIRHQALYEQAMAALHEFNTATGITHRTATQTEFQRRVLRAEHTSGLSIHSTYTSKLIMLIIADLDDLATLSRMESWLASRDDTKS